MLSLKAFAKVNFGLSVLEKKKDGFHDIESIFQKIDFYDEIFIEKTDKKITFNTDTPPYGDENICHHVIEKFFKDLELNGGVKVYLKKNIWQGSGLGGASSDAAVLLKGLNQIFDYPLKQDALFDIALSLSSDAPFFLYGNTAIVRGRGEKISPINLNIPIYLVLVYPGFKIETAYAYNLLDEEKNREKRDLGIIIESLKGGNIDEFATSLYNDFDRVVIKKYPELAKIKERLSNHGCIGICLSGSGSVVYGIIKERDDKNRWKRIIGLDDVRIVECLM